MKTTLYIIFISIVLSSCSGNKFLNRKYTTGFFTESHKNLKHNTIKAENEQSLVSLNSNIELKKSNCIHELQTEKEIINAKVNSITKRDSIFHILKRGKDEIIVLKNDLPDVYMKLNPKKNKKIVINKNSLPLPLSKAAIEKDLRVRTIIGLLVFFVPIMGILIAIQTKKRIKKYRQQNPDVNYDHYKNLANLGLALSILPSLILCLLVLAFVALILALCFSSSGFFAIALL